MAASEGERVGDVERPKDDEFAAVVRDRSVLRIMVLVVVVVFVNMFVK